MFSGVYSVWKEYYKIEVAETVITNLGIWFVDFWNAVKTFHF